MTHTFDPKTHSYLIDGKPATGITTIISVLAKPALIGWAARTAVEYLQKLTPDIELGYTSDQWTRWCEEAKTAHNTKRDSAATHGTDAHALVEKYIKQCMDGNDFGYPITAGYWPEYKSIESFTRWAEENVDHFLFSERQMFNEEKFIAGTADFGCVMKDGKKLIGDFKTSSGVYGIDYFLQCAGYKFLAEAEGDAPYDGCVIVRLGKKGPKDFDVHYRYVSDEEAFMACLTLYRAQATYKKP